MELKGKRVAILGAGSSGFAAALLALSHGASVEAFDSGNAEKLAAAAGKFAAVKVPFTVGGAALAPAGQFDLAVISPGIDLSWPIARAFADISTELIGEIEFAWRLSDTPVIAITGTNGKTTTTSLVADMLKGAGFRSCAAGNIGLAYSEVVGREGDFDWIVLEVSSFQLESVKRFRPEVAVWMNFAPDHMDRYASVEDYRAAKMRLFENLGPDALVIRKEEDSLGGLAVGETVTFSGFSDGGDFFYREGTIVHRASGRGFDFGSCELQGKHNAENVMVALAVADRLGIEWEDLREVVSAFRAPAHRGEKVGVFGGATWVNDSKSTNLHSLRSALAAQERPVILLAGGKDKGLDFSELKELVREKVRVAVSFGEMGETIASVWKGATECHPTHSLEEAVLVARRLAREGDIVLLSPGTSSFDLFSGYEARGEAFRKAVARLAAS